MEQREGRGEQKVVAVRLIPAIPYTKPLPLGRIARNYTVLNLNGAIIQVRDRWRRSVLDYRLWCYNNSDMRLEIGHVNRRCCILPPEGHFFVYMSYNGKWLCSVIDGPSGYLFGYITRSVGKVKDLRIRENCEPSKFIQHAKKLPYDGGYESTKLTKCGDLAPSFMSIYRHVEEEDPAPPDEELIRAGETFILHFTESAKNEKLHYKNIFTRFRTGHPVGSWAILEAREWRSSCDTVYSALGISDEEFCHEPKDARHREKRKKMTTETTAMLAKNTLKDLRLLYRPNHKPGYLLLKDMPMHLSKDGPADPLWAEKELLDSCQPDLGNANWEFLTQPFPEFSDSDIDGSIGKLVHNACMNTGDFIQDKLVAYHESGHALVALHTPAAHAIRKITIIPQGASLGMVLQVAEKDNASIGEKQILASLDVCLGGIVAQELAFGEQSVTAVAEQDLVTARDLAHDMVSKYRVGDAAEDLPSAGEMRERINAEGAKLLEESRERVKLLLKKHWEQLEAIVNALLKETLTSDEILDIVHRCQEETLTQEQP
ncbi:unnamed protein product [Urochloa humidicola]